MYAHNRPKGSFNGRFLFGTWNLSASMQIGAIEYEMANKHVRRSAIVFQPLKKRNIIMPRTKLTQIESVGMVLLFVLTRAFGAQRLTAKPKRDLEPPVQYIKAAPNGAIIAATKSIGINQSILCCSIMLEYGLFTLVRLRLCHPAFRLTASSADRKPACKSTNMPTHITIDPTIAKGTAKLGFRTSPASSAACLGSVII